MVARFRSLLLVLSLAFAGSLAVSSISHAQMNDPPTTGGTKTGGTYSRYVGGAPSASPWISLGNVLAGEASARFGSLQWLAAWRQQVTIARRGSHPARQLSW